VSQECGDQDFCSEKTGFVIAKTGPDEKWTGAPVVSNVMREKVCKKTAASQPLCPWFVFGCGSPRQRTGFYAVTKEVRTFHRCGVVTTPSIAKVDGDEEKLKPEASDDKQKWLFCFTLEKGAFKFYFNWGHQKRAVLFNR